MAGRPPCRFPLWKTVRGPVLECGCPPVPAASLWAPALGTHGGHVGMRAQGRPLPAESWPPASGHQQAAPLGPAKAGAEQAGPPGRGRHQPPGGPGLRGPWGGRVSRSQGSPEGVFLLAPPSPAGRLSPRRLWVGSWAGPEGSAGRGAAFETRIMKKKKHTPWPVEGSCGPGSLAHGPPWRDRRPRWPAPRCDRPAAGDARLGPSVAPGGCLGRLRPLPPLLSSQPGQTLSLCPHSCQGARSNRPGRPARSPSPWPPGSVLLGSAGGGVRAPAGFWGTFWTCPEGWVVYTQDTEPVHPPEPHQLVCS